MEVYIIYIKYTDEKYVCICYPLRKKYKNPVFSVICVIVIDNQTVINYKL